MEPASTPSPHLPLRSPCCSCDGLHDNYLKAAALTLVLGAISTARRPKSFRPVRADPISGRPVMDWAPSACLMQISTAKPHTAATSMSKERRTAWPRAPASMVDRPLRLSRKLQPQWIRKRVQVRAQCVPASTDWLSVRSIFCLCRSQALTGFRHLMPLWCIVKT